MRVLITGGAGFLGSHLAEAWLERGQEVTVLDPAGDLKVRHLRPNPRFRAIRETVLNREILDGLVAWSDLVYHLAAVVGVEHYVGDPYQVLTVNINGVQDVLAAAFRHQKKVVFSSTSEVYGRSTAVPFEEDGDRVLGSTQTDRWCYATSKAIYGLWLAQYETLRAHGHSPSEAFNETVEEATQSLYPLIAENGMDWMYANCSTTAQRGALDWFKKFRDAARPVFERRPRGRRSTSARKRKSRSAIWPRAWSGSPALPHRSFSCHLTPCTRTDTRTSRGACRR